MEKNKLLKMAVLAIFFVLVFASAVQAIVKINIYTENETMSGNILNKGELGRSIWEDNFNDASKIDPSPPGQGQSDNYVVSGGQVSMINTYPVWTDISWAKMKPITLSNAAGQTLYDYVLHLIVDYDDDMQLDYDDMRFKHEDYETIWLDYWIETYDSNEAIVWVKIPSIPTGNSMMYLFYGNSGAASQSDFDSVFSWQAEWANDERITYHLDKEGAWDPDVCYGNGEFLVCWEEGQAFYPPYTWGFKQEIRASIYEPDGTCIVFDKLVYKDSSTYYRNENPSIAYGGDKWFVAWGHYDIVANPSPTTMDIKARTVQRSGSNLQLGSVINVCTDSDCQADANVEFDSVNNRFCVVWEDARNGMSNYNIYGRLYNTNGNPVGSEKTIADGGNSECEPWVAFDPINEHYMIVWEEGEDPEDGPFDIWVGLFDEDLDSIGSLTKLADGNDDTDYNFPCVEFCEETERFLVTWNDGDISDGDWYGNIWGTILDTSGNVVVSTFQISGGEFVRTDIVPYLSTLFFVSYDNNDKIWGKLVSSDGDIISSEIQISAAGDAEADWANMDVGDGKIFAAWEDTRVIYPYPWNNMPDSFGNIWDLNVPSGSEVSYLFGAEEDPVLSAHVTSIEIIPSNLGSWDIFNAIYTDSVTFDILDGVTGIIIIQGVTPGSSIQTVMADTIRLKATFSRSNPSYSPTLDYWSVSWQENNPPNTPQQPSGPTSGDTGVFYTYTTSTTDPDGDDVYYWFDWDDGTNSGWVGPYASGATGSASHSWSNPGTYDIKVKAKDVHDAESGWSPTLTVTISIPNDPPNTPSNPDPYDGETGVDVDHDLSWDGGDPDSGDTVTYDVYFDDTSPPQFKETIGPYPSGQTSITYDPGTMDPNTQYYWKIVAEDNHGETSTGPEWSFTTENNPPYTPSVVSPLNGATGVDINADLSWTGGDPDPGDTVTYDVYFGTSSSPPYHGTTGPHSGDPSYVVTYEPGTLQYSTQYYWKIVAEDNHGAATTGPIWIFTTGRNSPPNTPSNPDPYDGETGVDVDHDLSWDGGDPDSGDTVTYDVYFDDTSPPQFKETIGPYPSGQTSITYDPGAMMGLTTYYWQIVTWDNHGASATGPEWSFTTEYVPNNPPNTPYDPDPPNHATDVDVNYDLSWSGGDPDPYDTVTYDVYFGTSSPPPKVVSNQTELTYDPGTMPYGTKHYWRIVAWDNHGAYASSPIWDFTTHNDPPYKPSNPDPYDGETGVNVDHDLSWTCVDPNGDPVTYDVYFGTSSPPPLVEEDYPSTTYDPGPMSYHTQYYWQIIAWDNHGASNMSDEWDFTTENRDPNPPSDPTPPDGATEVDVNADLSWTCSDPDGDTLVYDIYFDTKSPPDLYEEDWPYTTYDPGTMLGSTIYYWQIEAKDNYGGSTLGDVWSFTTEEVPNDPPDAPHNPNPPNGATDVSVDTDLSCDVSDPDGNSMDVSFYLNGDLVGTDENVPDGGTASVNIPFQLNYDTTYYWYAVADDGEYQIQSATWSFTTEQEPANNPPYTPRIDGPILVVAGQVYDFTFSSDGDPDEDDIKFVVNWGDGNVEETEYIDGSHPVAYMLSHSWDPPLFVWMFVITAYAEDEHGAQSGVAQRLVFIIDLSSQPYNQPYNQQSQSTTTPLNLNTIKGVMSSQTSSQIGNFE